MAYIGKNVLKIYLISYPKTFPGKNEMKGTEDIFISGDVDEVMSRQALHQLRCFYCLEYSFTCYCRWCELRSDLLTGALWMPMVGVQRAGRRGNC